MSREIEDRIGDLARRQHGVVSRAQLLEVGLQPGTVCRRIQAGGLRILPRGVYLVGPIAPAHAREMAAVLACGRHAHLGFRTAAAYWGCAAGGLTEVTDVVVPGRLDRRRRSVRIHRVSHLDDADRAVRHGIPVTSPIRTILDFAAVASARELEHAVATAERERLVEPADLLERLRSAGPRRGAPLLRAVLASAGGPALTRSEAERRFLALVRSARLPVPVTNVTVEGYEIDFLWPDECVAVEVDGYRHHAPRTRFESDRRRATCLAARGIHVIPITWRQIVEDGTATIVRLAQALVHARPRTDDGATRCR